jgi:hypothetical protein
MHSDDHWFRLGQYLATRNRLALGPASFKERIEVRINAGPNDAHRALLLLFDGGD